MSAVTDAPSRSTSTADASTPSTSAIASSTSARRSRGRRHDPPRFCHGSPAGTTSTRSRPSRLAHLGRHDDVAHVHGVERAAEHPEPLWSPGRAQSTENPSIPAPVTRGETFRSSSLVRCRS